jgi:hypothetical protein
MSIRIGRPLVRRWPLGHPVPHITPYGARPCRGGGVAVQLGGPAGPVGPTPNGMSFNGMDPSDPTTYVRPYNPQPGMIAWLNYDGAGPNRTQTV